MKQTYREIGKQAENAVRSIKDKELRREAFRILLLQMMAGASMAGNNPTRGGGRGRRRVGIRARRRKVGRPPRKGRVRRRVGVKRPGRRGGGVATVALQKLIDSGYFRKGRDAATVMNELARRRTRLMPSQLRMVLLRFSRARKLKRRIKMKGRKVTYLYTAK